MRHIMIVNETGKSQDTHIIDVETGESLADVESVWINIDAYGVEATVKFRNVPLDILAERI